MSAFKYLLACNALICLMWSCMSKVHINEFAVYIPGPQELADRVAAMYGFINKGQVSTLFCSLI